MQRASDLSRSLVNPIHGPYAPRLGIAYQLSNKTVLRTGYGIFYGFPEQIGGNTLGANPHTGHRPAAVRLVGNAGAGIIWNPGLVNFDVSVLKNFAYKERIRAQFRAEFFNFTNTPFFGALGTTFGLPTFGKISSASDPRATQLGLKVVF